MVKIIYIVAAGGCAYTLYPRALPKILEQRISSNHYALRLTLENSKGQFESKGKDQWDKQHWQILSHVETLPDNYFDQRPSHFELDRWPKIAGVQFSMAGLEEVHRYFEAMRLLTRRETIGNLPPPFELERYYVIV